MVGLKAELTAGLTAVLLDALKAEQWDDLLVVTLAGMKVALMATMKAGWKVQWWVDWKAVLLVLMTAVKWAGLMVEMMV